MEQMIDSKDILEQLESPDRREEGIENFSRTSALYQSSIGQTAIYRSGTGYYAMFDWPENGHELLKDAEVIDCANYKIGEFELNTSEADVCFVRLTEKQFDEIADRMKAALHFREGHKVPSDFMRTEIINYMLESMN